MHVLATDLGITCKVDARSYVCVCACMHVCLFFELTMLGFFARWTREDTEHVGQHPADQTKILSNSSRASHRYCDA